MASSPLLCKILIWEYEHEGFLMQELEPNVYSIPFGDQRLLEGRKQDVMQRYTPDVPLLKRIVEYQHPEHLRSPSPMGGDRSQDMLDTACHQVRKQMPTSLSA